MTQYDGVWSKYIEYVRIWSSMIGCDWVWLILIECDSVWLCMIKYDDVWWCMMMYDMYVCMFNMYDRVWSCMIVYDHVWPKIFVNNTLFYLKKFFQNFFFFFFRKKIFFFRKKWFIVTRALTKIFGDSFYSASRRLKIPGEYSTGIIFSVENLSKIIGEPKNFRLSGLKGGARHPTKVQKSLVLGLNWCFWGKYRQKNFFFFRAILEKMGSNGILGLPPKISFSPVNQF